ncbi:MAG: NAD(P)-dependent oxidoreductase [Candidatus Staskawiczbacteria bacterium]|nr:NAD(P)-dependent oxidoreductase [Candidatus Staskawiczbacteria bacterium]
MTNRKKRILLTGGSGFIGKNIVEILGGQHDIIAPLQQELNLLDSQAVADFFKQHPVDIIIHAAHIGGYVAEEEINIASAQNILMFFNLARQLGPHQRMVFLGSGAEYDKRVDIASISEEDFDRSVPIDSYGFAKYVCSKYIAATTNITNLRCFGVYGKYEQTSRFISNAILTTLKKQPITIRQNTYFDYLYVNDLVTILNHCIMHEPKRRFYNATSGYRIDLATLASLVQKIAGVEYGITIGQEGFSKEYTGSNARLQKEIPHLQLTSLEDGIKALFAYYQSKL